MGVTNYHFNRLANPWTKQDVYHDITAYSVRSD